MKNFSLTLFLTLVVLNVFASNLQKDFENPKDLARAGTWYHFTSAMITKEGITADIEAMRDIGYDSAHIFAIGGGAPKQFENPVKLMSPQWEEMMKHLGREAKRCGIKLGMHNCTGWSSSGGPWIKVEDSMKKLTASEVNVDGGNVNIKLPKPQNLLNFYKDVAVLALLAKQKMPLPKITSTLNGAENIFATKSLTIPTATNKGGSVVFEFEKPYSSAFAKFEFNPVHVYINIAISVSDDGKQFKEIAKTSIASFKDKGAPKFVSFEKMVSAKFYKFDFIPRDFPEFFNKRHDISLRSINLLQDAMIRDVDKKISIVSNYGYTEPKGKIAKGVALNSIVNLTDKMNSDGTLVADLPEGNWKILRIGYTTTGAKNAPSALAGLECDKLSKRGLDAHWEHYMGKMQKWLGGSLHYATIDSYEVGGQNWTEGFDAEFKKRRGYDITKYLPCVFGYIVADEKQSEKFLYDLQKTVSELFCENYFDYFHALCKKNGLVSIAESYGGPFDNFRASRHFDFPVSEFWVRQKPPSKSVSSIANLLGKKRCGTESFTSSYQNGRWSIDPAELKIYGDNAWAMGVNSFIMHTYVHQPFNAGPGFTLGKHGSDLHRLNTWWQMGKAWVSYVNRAQTLLQAGRALKQVLIVSPASSPNSMWEASVNTSIVSAGFDYDICSFEDLGDILFVDNGKIKASKNGASYELLVVEKNRLNTIEKIKAIEKLVSDGANILAERPVDSPSLSDDKSEFDAIVARIWGSGEAVKNIGKGKLFTKGSVVGALIKLKVAPRCIAKNILTVCRTNGTHDIFYIVNPSKNSFNKKIFFNVANGKIPQLWDADTGKIENIAEYKKIASGVEIPLYFRADESKFIVFINGQGQGIVDLQTSQKLTETKIEIIEAKFGNKAKNQFIDVADLLKKNIASEIWVANKTFGSDPSPFNVKKLYLKYRINGKEKNLVLAENTLLRLVDNAPEKLIYTKVDGDKVGVCFEENGTANGECADKTKFSFEVKNLPEPLDISNDWVVRFQKNRGVPDMIKLAKTQSLSDSKIDGVKYFSGTMQYEKEIEIPSNYIQENRKLILEFEEIYNIAQVEINGKFVHTLWKYPYRCDITKYLKEGKNIIKVRVANLWVNRLIGDDHYPQEHLQNWVMQGKTKSESKRFTSSDWTTAWSKKDKLFKSGIVGKVQIKPCDIIPIKNN